MRLLKELFYSIAQFVRRVAEPNMAAPALLCIALLLHNDYVMAGGYTNANAKADASGILGVAKGLVGTFESQGSTLKQDYNAACSSSESCQKMLENAESTQGMTQEQRTNKAAEMASKGEGAGDTYNYTKQTSVSRPHQSYSDASFANTAREIYGNLDQFAKPMECKEETKIKTYEVTSVATEKKYCIRKYDTPDKCTLNHRIEVHTDYLGSDFGQQSSVFLVNKSDRNKIINVNYKGMGPFDQNQYLSSGTYELIAINRIGDQPYGTKHIDSFKTISNETSEWTLGYSYAEVNQSSFASPFNATRPIYSYYLANNPTWARAPINEINSSIGTGEFTLSIQNRRIRIKVPNGYRVMSQADAMALNGGLHRDTTGYYKPNAIAPMIGRQTFVWDQSNTTTVCGNWNAWCFGPIETQPKFYYADTAIILGTSIQVESPYNWASINKVVSVTDIKLNGASANNYTAQFGADRPMRKLWSPGTAWNPCRVLNDTLYGCFLALQDSSTFPMSQATTIEFTVTYPFDVYAKSTLEDSWYPAECLNEVKAWIAAGKGCQVDTNTTNRYIVNGTATNKTVDIGVGFNVVTKLDTNGCLYNRATGTTLCGKNPIYKLIPTPPLPGMEKLWQEISFTKPTCGQAYIPADCQQDISDGTCSISQTTCITRDSAGKCIKEDVTLNCDQEYNYEMESVDKTVICNGTVACMDGSCEDDSEEVNTDFVEYAKNMSIAGEVKNMDISKGVLFTGQPMECQIYDGLTATVDCCEKPKGFSFYTFMKGMYAANKLRSILGKQKLVLGDPVSSMVIDGIYDLAGTVDSVAAPIEDIVTAAKDFAMGIWNNLASGMMETAQSSVVGQAVSTVSAGASSVAATLQAFQQAILEKLYNMASECLGQNVANMLVSKTVENGTTQFGAGSAITTVMAIYAIYTWVNMAEQLYGKCPKEQMQTPMALAQLREHYVGSYDDGISTTVRSFCVYENPLARIIMEQAIPQPQMQRNFGSPKNPLCAGLTLEELQKVDFSKIDFKEYMDILLASGILPKPSDNMIEKVTGEGSLISLDDAPRQNAVKRAMEKYGNQTTKANLDIINEAIVETIYSNQSETSPAPPSTP